MKKGGGRAKGSSFERQVASAVVHAFREKGITSADCYRTPLSGGHRAARQTDPGDLVISPKLARYFPFSVECKFYKKLWLPALWSPQKEWKKAWHFGPWLEQTCNACTSDKSPLLVFKGNNTPVFAALPTTFLMAGIGDSDALVAILVGARPILLFKYNGKDWCVMLFSKLLRRLKYASKTAF